VIEKANFIFMDKEKGQKNDNASSSPDVTVSTYCFGLSVLRRVLHKGEYEPKTSYRCWGVVRHSAHHSIPKEDEKDDGWGVADVREEKEKPSSNVLEKTSPDPSSSSSDVETPFHSKKLGTGFAFMRSVGRVANTVRSWKTFLKKTFFHRGK
jgi:hypothetical protein